MRWHTVGGRLRSVQQTRRLVKKRWRQTRTTDSTALVSASAFRMPGAVPAVIAPALGGGIVQIETIAEAAVSKSRRRMADLMALWSETG